MASVCSICCRNYIHEPAQRLVALLDVPVGDTPPVGTVQQPDALPRRSLPARTVSVVPELGGPAQASGPPNAQPGGALAAGASPAGEPAGAGQTRVPGQPGRPGVWPGAGPAGPNRPGPLAARAVAFALAGLWRGGGGPHPDRSRAPAGPPEPAFSGACTAHQPPATTSAHRRPRPSCPARDCRKTAMPGSLRGVVLSR